MMRKLAQTIFLRAPTAPKFRFCNRSTKDNESQGEVRNQQPKTEYHEDQQYQYQNEDRTTTGWIIYRFLFWGSASLLGYNVYKVAYHQKDTPVEDEPWTTPGFIKAAKGVHNSYTETTQYFTKPPAQKLLPDPFHPLLHPKTLVLNVTGTLLQTQYKFGKGLVIKKRPGLQQFLNKLKTQYEVVLFSDDDSMLLETLIPSLDPRQQIIRMYFGHQCMVLSGSKYIKDLKYLNRDMRNIVVIDLSKDKVPKQKDNVIPLSVYHGDENDRQLLNLLPLLQSLSRPEVKDVRKHIKQLGDSPLEKYTQLLKEKQQKMKNNKSGKIFSFFSSKK